MAHHGCDEECGEMQHDRDQWGDRDRHHENGGGRGQYRLKPNEDWEDGNLSRPKNEHESREIERERNDP